MYRDILWDRKNCLDVIVRDGLYTVSKTKMQQIKIRKKQLFMNTHILETLIGNLRITQFLIMSSK